MLGTTRKQIRAAVQTALEAIDTVDARVVTGKPVPALQLPNITFNIEEESLDPDSSCMDDDEREFSLIIEGRALIREGADSPIDDLCLATEIAMANAEMSACCQDVRIESTYIEQEESERPIALATLRYVGYYNDAVEVDPVWIQPTVDTWSVNGVDNGAANARMMFVNCVTDGSPCQVKWRLMNTGATYNSKYSSPEQNSPHAVNIDIVNTTHRGKRYDLYWAWTSEEFVGDWQLVAANAVYVPANGEGDIISNPE